VNVEAVKPFCSIVTCLDDLAGYPRRIEEAARMCYRSEPSDYPEGFVRARIAQGHESVIEHCHLSVKFTLSRAAANQLVRHRLASFTQESLRYTKQASLQVVPPGQEMPQEWWQAIVGAAYAYEALLSSGMKAEDARSVLPLCTVTRVLVTANLREWRHILRIRTERHAQAEIRELMTSLLYELHDHLPCIFEDIEP
jgi:thymidylate synthase (FAD)